MEKKSDKANRSGKGVVRDLTPHKGQDVKGGDVAFRSNMMKKLNEISMAVINNLR